MLHHQQQTSEVPFGGYNFKRMSNDTGNFSYKSLVGYPIVADDARSHAPFPKRRHSSPPASSNRAMSPICPQRGLARWGSEIDILSQQIPRPPSRGGDANNDASVGGSLSPLTPPIPPPPSWEAAASPGHHRLETRISRIRSRWNSQICREGDLSQSMGKISSPTMPKRVLEDVLMPVIGDDNRGEERDDHSFFPSRPEGACWKHLLHNIKKNSPSSHEDKPDRQSDEAQRKVSPD